MSDDTTTEAEAPPAADTSAPDPGAATPEQDSWLHQTLGLDVAKYADEASQAAGDMAGGLLDTLAAAKDSVVKAVGDGVNAVETVATTLYDGAVAAKDAAVQAVGDGIDAVKTAVGGMVDGVKKAFSGPPPVPRADLGPAQTDRASKKLAAMPPADQQKVQGLLDRATPDEKKYLQKALSSNHSAAEMQQFYQQIAGKDAAWMEQNLHVVGQADGKGIKQQYHDSCAPTTVQAMKAELDPVYALKLRTESTDLTEAPDDDPKEINPELAEEQRKLLVDHGGKAVARDADGGKGMSMGPALNEQKGTTGLDFTLEPVDSTNVDAALDDIDKSIGDGLPVPMRLGNAKDGHAVLVTGMDPGPPRRYSIHDPWDGKTVTVTDAQIKNNDFNIANWNHVSHIYKPSPTPDPAPGP